MAQQFGFLLNFYFLPMDILIENLKRNEHSFNQGYIPVTLSKEEKEIK